MDHPVSGLLPATDRALRRRLAIEQRDGRVPSLVAGVVRDGALVWSAARGETGLVGPDTAGPDTQYRIGSISKTFTAALVMQLRDEGRLELTDPVERHLPGTAVAQTRLAALLSHSGGLAAETTGPWWERTDGTDRSLAEVLGDAPRRHREGRLFHYSNLGYGVLGEVVAALTGSSWQVAVDQRLLAPLGMSRTTSGPVIPYARGLAVHPWADLVLAEPEHHAGVLAPAGQLWSTVADLARWTQVLAGDRGDVVAAATVAEMAEPAAVADTPTGWATAYGLGLQVFLDTAGSRAGGRPRRLVGHTGSMPGFLATLWLSPEDGVAAVAMANATAGPALSRFVADLVDIVAAAEPAIPAVWAPSSDPDPALLTMAGLWHWGPAPFAVRITRGRQLHLFPVRGAGRESAFRPISADTWVGLDGYYRGETLRAHRDPAGRVTHLELASFVFTRAPYEPAAPVPGGVDPGGWTTGY